MSAHHIGPALIAELCEQKAQRAIDTAVDMRDPETRARLMGRREALLEVVDFLREHFARAVDDQQGRAHAREWLRGRRG